MSSQVGTEPVRQTLPPAVGLWGDRGRSGAVGLIGGGSQLELGPAVVGHEVQVGRVALDVAADERAERQHRRPPARVASRAPRASKEPSPRPSEARAITGWGEAPAHGGRPYSAEPAAPPAPR